MTSSEFFNKFKSKYLWGNLFAMGVVVALLCVGVKFGIELYTHHGEAILIPDILLYPTDLFFCVPVQPVRSQKDVPVTVYQKSLCTF